MFVFNFQQLIFYLLIRCQINEMKILKEVMEMDFWSVDVPFSCKKKLAYIFQLIKLGCLIAVLNLVFVVTLQFITHIYVHWPFISSKMYPCYIAATALYTFGSFITIYTHCIIYCYMSFHTYCQMLLLNEYYKQLRSSSSQNRSIAVSLTDYIVFGIKQYTKLVR